MTTAALTQELRLVEDDLARLRKTAADLRRRIGDRDEEPTDAAERSALIEAAEEQEALIDQLEARREHLLRRLGGLTDADRESHRLRGLQPRVVLSGSENPAPLAVRLATWMEDVPAAPGAQGGRRGGESPDEGAAVPLAVRRHDQPTSHLDQAAAGGCSRRCWSTREVVRSSG
jgi:hypothetical protein